MGLIAYVLGGEAGARTAAELGLPVSPDTLLRQLRGRPTFTGPAPRVLGVDDFAFRRGQHDGPLLVDLETGTPIDLLPDRTAETLATCSRNIPARRSSAGIGAAAMPKERGKERPAPPGWRIAGTCSGI